MRAFFRNRTFIPAAATLVWLAPPANPANAAEESTLPGLELQWDAPQDCPAGVDVKRSIARIVGDQSSFASRVRGVIWREDGQFRIEVDTERGQTRGRRSFAAPDCALATAAAVVVIATFIADPGSASPHLAGRGETVAPVESPIEKRDTAPDASGRPTRVRLSPSAGLGVFVDSATLPVATPGVLATMATEWPHARVLAGVGGTPPSHGTGRETLDGRTLGVDANLWFGSLRGGIHSNGRRLSFGGQAGADIGLIHATGVGTWTRSACVRSVHLVVRVRRRSMPHASWRITPGLRMPIRCAPRAR